MGFISNAQGSLMDILLHHLTDSDPWWIPWDISWMAVTKHVFVLWVVGLFLGLIVFKAAFSLKKSLKSRVATLVQVFLDFIDRNLLRPNFGSGSKVWLPFFATLFLFIMFSNLFGLFPGSATITGNLAVTLSLSVVTFLLTQGYGMKKQGFFKYWVRLVPHGIPKLLWPLMFFIELVGLISKPFALTIRLFANMIAGHIVILVLLYLGAQTAGNWIQLGIAPLTVLGALMVNLLEIFIAILQAYIFSFLSAIFISSASKAH